ncbi:arylformamidase [Aspergillus foveolatus]|uniref:arylformamidase n=1 Tax=Aspergillus foveolatus TaxID=210207 RepID=UPI003CCDE282
MSLETFPYGDHDLQTVTVAKPYPARAPLHAENTDNESGYWVILIHGGAWRDPTQTSTSYLAPTLSILSSSESKSPNSQSQHIRGLASISYRLSPHPSHPQDASTTMESHLRNAKHPEHINDTQLALSFLQRKYRFGKRYILVGHSCGATLAFQAVMASLSAQGREDPVNGYIAPLAILGMAGIYNLRLLRDSHRDISAYQEFIEGAFGKDEKVWDAASPGVVRGVDGVEGWKEGRLVVLAHSKEDELCDMEQSERMREFLEVWKGNDQKRLVQFLDIKGRHDEAWEKGEELARGILFTIENLQGFRK